MITEDLIQQAIIENNIDTDRIKCEQDTWTVYAHIIPKEITKYDYDKYYIGITHVPIEKRWKNGWGYSQMFFGEAIRKYHWVNIQHQILFQNLNFDEASSLEIYFIKKLSSNDWIHGYNISPGGNLVAPCSIVSGKNHHNAQSIVLLNSGKIYETITSAKEEWGIRLQKDQIYGHNKKRCSYRDQDNNVLVFMYYEDYIKLSKDQISEIIKTETMHQGQTYQKDPIVCLNTGECFYYIIDILTKYNISKHSLNKCLCGFQQTTGVLNDGTRMLWVRQSVYSKLSQDDIDKMIANCQPKPPKTVPILDTLTNIVYKSRRHCEQLLGFNDGHVKYKLTTYDTRFQRYEDYLKQNGISDLEAQSFFTFA